MNYETNLNFIINFTLDTLSNIKIIIRKLNDKKEAKHYYYKVTKIYGNGQQIVTNHKITKYEHKYSIKNIIRYFKNETNNNSEYEKFKNILKVTDDDIFNWVLFEDKQLLDLVKMAFNKRYEYFKDVRSHQQKLSKQLDKINKIIIIENI